MSMKVLPARVLAMTALALALAVAPALAQTSQSPSGSTTPGFGGINTGGTRPDPTTTAPVQPPAPVTPTTPPVTPTAPPPNPSRDQTSVTTPGGTPNPGDFAEDLVRAEAERSLGPPKPVIRLDQPEFVFSSADPEVAAGVKAWLATLQGPHDKYGNFMGPGYKGSFRPDSVNKELVTFLANYLKDKRLVAISPGQATGLASLQEKSRKDAVETIVQQRREQASKPATPPGTGSGTGENVPNIGNGGDNRNGNGGTPGTTGTASNPGTRPSTGSGPGAPTTTGNQSGSALTSSSLEQKFQSIKVDSSPKAFTPDELGMLDEVLGKMPKPFWEKVQFRRTNVITFDGKPDERVFGVTRTSRDMPNPLLELSDRSFSDKAGDRIDFPTPPFPAEQSKALQFKSTVAHEMGHRFLRYNPGDTFYSDINKNPLIQDWAQKFGWTFDPAGQKWALDPKRKKEAVTAYAAEDNPNEDLCESLGIYMYDPARLRAASPERYAFIRDTLKVAEQPDQPVTYPPPKNDPRYGDQFASN